MLSVVWLRYSVRYPKDPCAQIVYKAPKIRTTLRPLYILFGYMDLEGHCQRVEGVWASRHLLGSARTAY